MHQTDLTGKILLVDDHPLTIKLLTAMMQREGFTVKTAVSGEDSLALLESYVPDLILLDIRLPGMDGFEVCRRIKQNPRTSELPVLILSVLDSANEKVKALRSGAVDYINKPFSVEEVLTRVRVHMSLHRLQQDLAQKNAQLAREIKEREKAELELKRVLAELEELNAVQTEALAETQKRLIRQDKLAALGKLAGNIGHELRNPLGAVKNAAYFLTMALDDMDPEVQEALEIMNREVNKSAAIIDTLMSFARAKPPGKQKLSLKELLVETVSEMERANGIEVVWQLDEAIPPVYADREQLARVFHNLIRNGIEAMPDGGRLFVSTAVAGTAVIITIKDTGVGIPPENQAQLFELLFTTKSNGIGLGLALVRSLVEAHGGEIAVESQVEKGSAFKVRLPAAAEE